MKTLIYIEVFILIQFYILFKKIKRYMIFTSTTAKFFSENRCHVWEIKKAKNQYLKGYEEELTNQIKDFTEGLEKHEYH